MRRVRWQSWLLLLLLTNAAWLGYSLGQRQAIDELTTRSRLIWDDGNLGFCRAQRERLRTDLWRCEEGKQLVFSLDERRAECESYLIRWSDVPMTCYEWDRKSTAPER